jgi:hypothetical protein
MRLRHRLAGDLAVADIEAVTQMDVVLQSLTVLGSRAVLAHENGRSCLGRLQVVSEWTVPNLSGDGDFKIRAKGAWPPSAKGVSRFEPAYRGLAVAENHYTLRPRVSSQYSLKALFE